MADLPSDAIHTIRFMSDGLFVYWMYALKAQESLPHPITAEKIKQHSVYIQPLTIQVHILCVIGQYHTRVEPPPYGSY